MKKQDLLAKNYTTMIIYHDGPKKRIKRVITDSGWFGRRSEVVELSERLLKDRRRQVNREEREGGRGDEWKKEHPLKNHFQ